MAIKKINEIQFSEPQEYKILDSDGVNVPHDSFGIGGIISDIQNLVMQAAYRKLKGWMLRGVSATGFLARVPGTSDREFVVRVVLSFEFAPFTGPAIDRAVAVYQDKEREFFPNPVE
jgi:hypothetical protein